MSNLNVDFTAPAGCFIGRTSLEANHILHITAIGPEDKEQVTSFDLDSFIGNVNGALSLGHSDFSTSARSVVLSEDGKTLDAEIPDVNGDFSTSSLILAHAIGSVDGELGLLLACGAPHSTAHSNADSIEEADAHIMSQAQILQPDLNVAKVVTLHCPTEYELGNPNSEWVKQNLGPYGGVGAIIEVTKVAVAGVYVTSQVAQHSSCSIM